MEIFFRYSRPSRFGSKAVLLYFFFFLIITPFFISAIPNFIDFDSYQAIVEGGWAWEKYRTEPLSAGLLMLMHYGGFGALGLYLSSWFISFAGFIFVLSSQGKAKGTLYLFLILNPIALVLLQFSRQYLAYIFFIVAVLTLSNKLKSKIGICASFLSHNASSGFSLLLYRLVYSRILIFVVIILIATVAFSFISFTVFPEYTHHDVVRGRGRVALVIVSFLFFMTISIKRPKVILLFFLMMACFIFMYYVSPQAGRFAPYFLAFLASYGVFTFNSTANIFLIHSFFIANIVASFFMVTSGLYGFG